VTHNHYTPEALAALDADIEVAQERHTKAMYAMGSDESSHESWHDNPAFEQAKQDEDMARTHLAKLRALRRDAIVVERDGASTLVEVGSTIRVLIDGEDEPMIIHMAGHFVGVREGDDGTFMMSTTSPMGKALMGKSESEHVTYTSGTGKALGATILELVN